MDDLIRTVLVVLKGMWARRWLGLAVAWIVALVGTLAIVKMPQRFEAAARIRVDTQSVLGPLMTGLAVQPNVEQQVAMLSRTLISRPNMEKLVDMAGLETETKPKAALVEELVGRLAIHGAGRENLYTLAYRDSDPVRAKKVVESLATIFVESNRGHNIEDSAEAKQFLDEQIKSYEAKLEEAENRLKEFKLRHLGQSSGTGQATAPTDYFTRMEELRTRLTDARLELREAEQSRDALRRQIAGEAPTLAGGAEEVSEIDSRIDALKRNLDTLLQRFTEQHPDVVGARRVIAELEEQRAREAAARGAAGAARPASSSTANRVYQELRVSLATAEASAASLRARVEEYERRYQQLKDSARMVPEIEAQLAQLNRDYDVNRRQYEALVTRREQAAISGDMESAGAGGAFRIIDPPRVPSRPIGPGRPALMLLLLVGALAAGAGASFAAARVWPYFFDGHSLREVTGLPVLGSVSLRQSEAARKQARGGLVRFLGALLSLFLAHGTALVLLLTLGARAN